MYNTLVSSRSFSNEDRKVFPSHVLIIDLYFSTTGRRPINVLHCGAPRLIDNCMKTASSPSIRGDANIESAH